MPLPFPYSRGQSSPEAYLARLISAIITKHGGEIALTAREILSVPPDASLTKTIDLRRERVVLRCSPVAAEQFCVSGHSPEGERWEQRPKRSPEEIPKAPPSVIPQQRKVEAPPGYRVARPEEAAILERMHQSDPRNPPSRHAVLDDVSIWLMEQEKLAETQAPQQASQSGDYPWRVDRSR